MGDEADKKRGALARELKSLATRHRFWSVANDWCDVVLSIIAIGASIISAVLAATGAAPAILAACAAIPAGCVGLQKALDNKRRDQWHSKIAAYNRAMYIRIAEAPESEFRQIAQERAAFEVRMSEEWSSDQGAGPARIVG